MKLSRRLVRKQVLREIERCHATSEESQSEVAQAYVARVRAFELMTDESVGGAGFEEALQNYRHAAGRYRAACRTIGTSTLRLEHDLR